MTEAVLADWRTAPVEPKVHAALGLVETLTLEPSALRPEDLRSVRAAGISDEAIVDVIYVCGLFNTLDRIADSLGFDVPAAAVHRSAARFLLRRGYKLPSFAVR